jgi:hypothetical protein
VPEALASEAACRIRPCPPSNANTTRALTAYSVVRFAAIFLIVKPPYPFHKLGTLVFFTAEALRSLRFFVSVNLYVNESLSDP